MTRGGAGREAGPQPMSLAPPHLPRNNQDVPARRWGAAWDLTCYFVRPAAARVLISPSREGLWLILVLGLGWGRKPSCEFASEPGARYLLLTRLCHFQVLWREVLNFQWEEKARGCCALVSLFGAADSRCTGRAGGRGQGRCPSHFPENLVFPPHRARGFFPERNKRSLKS